ncbi:hypothetical protein ZWY2020_039767, partial [Hordeum vulgare]
LHLALLLLVAAASGSRHGVAWLAVSGVAPALPYWLVNMDRLCMGSNSGADVDRRFSDQYEELPTQQRGCCCILKGYSGLSAAVYTAIYTASRLSCKPLAFSHPGSFHRLPSRDVLCEAFVSLLWWRILERVHFLFVQINSALLGVYLVVATTLDRFLTLTTALNYSRLLLCIPRKGTSAGDNDHTEPFLLPSSSEPNFGKIEDEDPADIDLLLAEGEGAEAEETKTKKGRTSDSVKLCLRQISGCSCTGVVGTTISVSLFSLGNFFGRLGGGAVSDYFVRSRTLPRTVLITCTQVVMIINYLVFALGLKATLYISVAILGICYGVHFSVMVSTSSELFGLKQFGKIYNFILLANPAMRQIQQPRRYVYDHEAQTAQHRSSGGL